MTVLNSVSAVFDVVKAARRVRAATSKPLTQLGLELQLLEKTLATLDRVEGKTSDKAGLATVTDISSAPKLRKARKPRKDPKRVEAGKRAYATRMARQGQGTAEEAPKVETETKKAARSMKTSKRGRKAKE